MKVNVGYPKQATPVLAKFTIHKQDSDRDMADLWLEMVYQAEDGKPRYFSDSYGDELALSDLVVTAYLRLRTKYESDKVGEIFGLSIEYRRPFSVDTRRAVAMAKLLASADKKLHAINEADGYTDDYALNAIRCLKAIGVEGLLVESSSGYWTVRPLGELTSMAWRAVHEAKKEAGIED